MKIYRLLLVLITTLSLYVYIPATADIEKEFEAFLSDIEEKNTKKTINKLQAIAEVDGKSICVVDSQIIQNCKRKK